ncbi:MAG: hypothetical protein GX418_09395 [Clostridiales bacterium]|nr:hypothetical protein [Clostridiales bacterium]
MGEAMILRRGGGFGRLRVIAAASASALPATAAEGTVAVVTGTAPGDLYAMATAPAGAVNGDLWMLTGAQSSAAFSLGRNTGVTLYPRCVYQRIAGAWAFVPAYVRLSGAWKPVSLRLYDAGVEMLMAVGQTDQGYNYGSTTYQKQSAAIRAYHGAQSGRWLWTVAPVDLTGIAAVKARFTSPYTSGYGKYLGIATDPGNAGGGTPSLGGLAAYAGLPAATVIDYTAALNVSGFTGGYYLGLYFYQPAGASDYLYEWWLEP